MYRWRGGEGGALAQGGQISSAICCSLVEATGGVGGNYGLGPPRVSATRLLMACNSSTCSLLRRGTAGFTQGSDGVSGTAATVADGDPLVLSEEPEGGIRP